MFHLESNGSISWGLFDVCNSFSLEEIFLCIATLLAAFACVCVFVRFSSLFLSCFTMLMISSEGLNKKGENRKVKKKRKRKKAKKVQLKNGRAWLANNGCRLVYSPVSRVIFLHLPSLAPSTSSFRFLYFSIQQ